MAEAAVFELVKESIRAEQETRKADKKLAKTKCGWCAGAADEGRKLQTCSRCKAVNYCSPACQNEHWKAGHKADCNGFARPPFARHFDTSDRADVPWPVDPVLASGAADGVGMWVTPHGPLSALLQMASDPLDLRAVPGLDGPPSFQRWAAAGAAKHETVRGKEQYLGGTVLGLRVVVHNRRRDGRVVALAPGRMELAVDAKLKGNLLPEDRKNAKEYPTKSGTRTVIGVTPWKDYNSLLRTVLLELNGAEAPRATFDKTTGEYQPAAKPVGAPWERVLDWAAGSVLLASGDYAVFACQYRIGDGHAWMHAPQILNEMSLLFIPAYKLEILSSEADWCEAARASRQLYDELRGGPGNLNLYARLDRAYFDEYYRPYFRDPHGGSFAAERLGSVAQLGDEHSDILPAALGQLMENLRMAKEMRRR